MLRYSYLLDNCIIQIYTLEEFTTPIYSAYYLSNKCKGLSTQIYDTERFELIDLAEIPEPKFFPIPSFSINNPYELEESGVSYKNTKDSIYVLTHSFGGIAYFKDSYQPPIEFLNAYGVLDEEI